MGFHYSNWIKKRSQGPISSSGSPAITNHTIRVTLRNRFVNNSWVYSNITPEDCRLTNRQSCPGAFPIIMEMAPDGPPSHRQVTPSIPSTLCIGVSWMPIIHHTTWAPRMLGAFVAWFCRESLNAFKSPIEVPHPPGMADRGLRIEASILMLWLRNHLWSNFNMPVKIYSRARCMAKYACYRSTRYLRTRCKDSQLCRRLGISLKKLTQIWMQNYGSYICNSEIKVPIAVVTSLLRGRDGQSGLATLSSKHILLD